AGPRCSRDRTSAASPRPRRCSTSAPHTASPRRSRRSPSPRPTPPMTGSWPLLCASAPSSTPRASTASRRSEATGTDVPRSRLQVHDHQFGDVQLVLLIFYTIFIGLVTLTPRQLDTSPGSLIGRLLTFLASHRVTQWLTYERVEMLANVGMFVPFGLLLALHLGRKRWWWG